LGTALGAKYIFARQINRFRANGESGRGIEIEISLVSAMFAPKADMGIGRSA
jgi:hypothetical protein